MGLEFGYDTTHRLITVAFALALRVFIQREAGSPRRFFNIILVGDDQKPILVAWLFTFSPSACLLSSKTRSTA